jgi:WhiB family redox-sensing transcriptional regulator
LVRSRSRPRPDPARCRLNQILSTTAPARTAPIATALTAGARTAPALIVSGPMSTVLIAPVLIAADLITREGIDVADTRRLPGPNADLWDWQLHAACRGMASSFFFHPEGERGPARARREAQAKAVCFECPAMAACRAHALQVHEPYGIWGGLSEGERAQMLTLSGAH